MAIKLGDIVIDYEFKYPIRCKVVKVTDSGVVVQEMNSAGLTISYKKSELHFLKKK